MNDQGNVALVLSVYDAFRRGDIAAVLNHIDPQAKLIFEGPSAIPWAGNRHGREDWAKFFQAIGENLDEITLTMEPFAVQGDNGSRRTVSGARQADWQADRFAAGASVDHPQCQGGTVSGTDRHCH